MCSRPEFSPFEFALGNPRVEPNHAVNIAPSFVQTELPFIANNAAVTDLKDLGHVFSGQEVSFANFH
jgi:hypothetical protein